MVCDGTREKGGLAPLSPVYSGERGGSGVTAVVTVLHTLGHSQKQGKPRHLYHVCTVLPATFVVTTQPYVIACPCSMFIDSE